MMVCDNCLNEFPGLSFAIPDGAWRKISGGTLSGILCPWCVSDRLKALGLHVRADVNLNLPGLDGTNPDAFRRFEEIHTQRQCDGDY